jgi:hypothetical protein
MAKSPDVKARSLKNTQASDKMMATSPNLKNKMCHKFKDGEVAKFTKNVSWRSRQM